MGKRRYDSEEARLELEALHAAVLKQQRQAGVVGCIISVRDWEAILISTLGTMTRQACNDKTWALDRMGLIQHHKREGVVILERVPA
jgi:hypothetical protein